MEGAPPPPLTQEGQACLYHPDSQDYPGFKTPPVSARQNSPVISGRVSPEPGEYYDSKGRLIVPAQRRSTGDDSEVRELAKQCNKIINDERLDKLEKLDKAQGQTSRPASVRVSSKIENARSRSAQLMYRDEQKRLLSPRSSREGLPRHKAVVEQREPPAATLAQVQKNLARGNSGGQHSNKKW